MKNTWMGGYRMYLNKYIDQNGTATEFPKFKDKNFVDLNLTATDLFLSQYDNTEFNAVDIAVKCLAIDEYYGLNNYGFNIYRKMQQLRINENWDERFLTLIKSFEKGFDDSSHLETDLNYDLHDGSHRLALALYHDMKEIPVRIYNTYVSRRKYGFAWFIENGFTENEINIIKEKLNELFVKSKKPYYCLLWPPARNYYDEIEKSITKVESGIDILSSENITIPSKNIKEFIYDVYSTDDIQKYKLDLKYDHMMQSLRKDNYNSLDYNIRVMEISFDNPDFRLKPLSGFPQSKKTMRLKKQIRSDYCDLITDYYYDIIMHITDNEKQNEEVKKLIKKIRSR